MIKVIVNGSEMTLDEARNLRDELNALLGALPQPALPQPAPPQPIPTPDDYDYEAFTCLVWGNHDPRCGVEP